MSKLDAFEQQIVDMIDQYGWFALSVAPRSDSDDPLEWFTYTIGLPKSRNWPEIICFGLEREVSYGILADAIAECDARNITPAPGLLLTQTLQDCNALLVDASAITNNYFGSATWYARHAKLPRPVPRLQLLWPDVAGKFPGDPACDPEIVACQTPMEK